MLTSSAPVATTEGNPFLTMHRFRPFTVLASLSGAAALGVALPSLVQAQVPAAQVRALNLARNTAVTQNGGQGGGVRAPTLHV